MRRALTEDEQFRNADEIAAHLNSPIGTFALVLKLPAMSAYDPKRTFARKRRLKSIPAAYLTLGPENSAPSIAKFGEDLFVVLAEHGRRRVDTGAAMGEGERGEGHAETTLYSGC
jgi:hypothetical protein